MDLIIIGNNGGDISEVYLNNGSHFNLDGSYSIQATGSGSIALYDFDQDGDLDLAFSGSNAAKIYLNNISSVRNNTLPKPPTTFTNTYTTGQFNISWNQGSDDITPRNGLYYNLKVGTTPNGNDILSGKYATSSNPTQGYLGNMMQLRNYSLNIKDQTMFWQVQTIDGGLRAGNWSEIQEYNPQACIVPSGNWKVNSTCSKINKILEVNGTINITGTLILINTTITMNGGGIQLLNEGNLTIKNSTIKAGNNSFDFILNKSTKFDMDYSIINGSNGLIINTSNLNLQNNMIQNNSFGIKLYGNNISIFDSIINQNTIDIYNEGFQNNITNVTFTTKNITTGSFYVRHYLDVTVLNISGAPLSESAVSAYDKNLILSGSSSTDSNGTLRFTLAEYVDSGTEDNYNNYSITASRPQFSQNNVNLNLTSNTQINITLNITNIPIFDGFTSELTTNFSNVSDVANVSNAKIGKTNLGQIKYLEPIDVSSLNLSQKIIFNHNYISVDITNAFGLNKKANLTLFNLSYLFTPVVLKDNSGCNTCEIISYSNGNLSFNVTGFSVYNTTPNSNLDVTVTDNLNNRFEINETVLFYANYTNTTSKQLIDDTNINCSINFGQGKINMSINNVLEVYQYNRSFISRDSYYYNISCDATSSGFEMLNYSSSLSIVPNATLFSIDTRQGEFGRYNVVWIFINFWRLK